MKKGQTKKVYSEEFKEGAIKLVLEEGYRINTAANNLGINPSLLSKWISRYKKNEGDLKSAFPTTGHLSPSDQKIKDLEKELRNVRMERDILKKAMVYFVDRPN